MADDSGLEVEALGGDPGIYSARYAGEKATDEDNISKLILNMEQHQNRSARFCCAMVFVKNAEDTKPIIIEKYWNGEILREAIGTNGFGYDSIFYLPDLKCSSAQLEPEKKNLLSHRGQALNELLRHLISS